MDKKEEIKYEKKNAMGTKHERIVRILYENKHKEVIKRGKVKARLCFLLVKIYRRKLRLGKVKRRNRLKHKIERVNNDKEV